MCVNLKLSDALNNLIDEGVFSISVVELSIKSQRCKIAGKDKML